MFVKHVTFAQPPTSVQAAGPIPNAPVHSARMALARRQWQTVVLVTKIAGAAMTTTLAVRRQVSACSVLHFAHHLRTALLEKPCAKSVTSAKPPTSAQLASRTPSAQVHIAELASAIKLFPTVQCVMRISTVATLTMHAALGEAYAFSALRIVMRLLIAVIRIAKCATFAERRRRPPSQ